MSVTSHGRRHWGGASCPPAGKRRLRIPLVFARLCVPVLLGKGLNLGQSLLGREGTGLEDHSAAVAHQSWFFPSPHSCNALRLWSLQAGQ